MQNVLTVAVPLDPLASCIYIKHKMSRTFLQPRPSFAWILLLRNFIFLNHRSLILILKCSFLWKKKSFMAFFRGWVSTASRPEWKPLWGSSLHFTIKFSEIDGTHFLSTSEGQTTQILKSDPTKGVSVVAKMLFPQVDEGFWLYYTSVWYKNI